MRVDRNDMRKALLGRKPQGPSAAVSQEVPEPPTERDWSDFPRSMPTEPVQGLMPRPFKSQGHHKGICVQPFVRLELFSLEGWRKIPALTCCNNWFQDRAFRLPLGSKEDIDQAWNGKYMQELRRSVLEGDYTYCNQERCPFLSSNSTATSEGFSQEVQDAIDKKLTYLPYGPKSITFSADKTCNLFCESCRSERIREKDTSLAERVFLSSIGPHTERMEMLGSGEVFMSPVTLSLLRSMSKEQYPSLRGISLLTNGNLLTPHMWDSLSPYAREKIDSIGVSVDACCEAAYNKLRRGGNFALLNENLHFLVGLRKEGGLNSLRLNMVVQDANLGEVLEFCLWAERLGVDEVRLDKIEDWGHLKDGTIKSKAIHTPGNPRYQEYTDMVAALRTLATYLKLRITTNLWAMDA